MHSLLIRQDAQKDIDIFKRQKKKFYILHYAVLSVKYFLSASITLLASFF